MLEFIKSNWLLFELIPVAIYYQLVVHELSHAFVVKFFFGYKITKIRLYPVRWGDFARCYWIEDENRPTLIDKMVSFFKRKKTEVKISKLYIYLAPFFGGIFSFLVGAFIGMVDSKISLLLMIIGISDGVLLLIGVAFGSDKSDGKMLLKSIDEDWDNEE